MLVLQTLYAWNRLDNSVCIGHDVATKDMIQKRLTPHICFQITLATYICDIVRNISVM